MTGQEPFTVAALLATLFASGLLGSLHCVGMCGPILLGFSRAMGERAGPTAFALYHGGRLWTYGLLGFAAGWAGMQLRHGAGGLGPGWQRLLGVGAGAVLVAAGALTWVAAPSLAPARGCGKALGQARALVGGLLRETSPWARLLLGVVMGFLPCGLVWAMLPLAASLSSPPLAAAGMVVFGLGTLPALSAVLMAGRFVPRRLATLRRLPGVLLVAVGVFAIARALVVVPGMHGH